MEHSVEKIRETLQLVKHPESGQSIVDSGMIEDLRSDASEINFTLKLKKMHDPLVNSIKRACESAIRSSFGTSVKINIDIRQPEKPLHNHKKEEAQSLPGVKNIVAVASGKGGVGKSTVAVNLAIALAKKGLKVGLLDADIYGPSLPKMFSLEDTKPSFKTVDNKDIIIPVEKYGVKVLSIGFFVDPKDALIWRGPMATGAVKQMITQAEWGSLDYLLIDLPPGTGDIHLTIVQEVPVTGVVIVSTPQPVALADAVKGIAMFSGDKINVPVLGLVENMAWFTPAELPENKYYIFGKEGCMKLAEEAGIDFLGQIPLVQAIREGGDSGTPSVLNDRSPDGKAFMELAENVTKAVEKRNMQMPPTKRVEMR